MAQHPTVASVMAFSGVMYNHETMAKLDFNSTQLMSNYSNSRKYVRGYYFKFEKNSENIKEFKFYHPQITERGIELLKFLNEKELTKRKKM